jgi:hypothetical protein
MTKRHPLKDIFLRIKNAAPVLHGELVEQATAERDKLDGELLYATPNDVLAAQGRAQVARWLLDCVVNCDPPPPKPTPLPHDAASA